MKRAIRRSLLFFLCLALAAWIGLGGRSGAQSGSGADAERDVATEPADRLLAPDQGYTLRQGAALFRHYCATCHGDGGAGDGLNAYNLDPRPRDLTDPELLADRSDQDLASVIRSGGAAVGLSHGMPPWGRTLDERQISQLVAHLRSRARSPDESGAG